MPVARGLFIALTLTVAQAALTAATQCDSAPPLGDTDPTAFPAERMSDAGQMVLDAFPTAYDTTASAHGTDE